MGAGVFYACYQVYTSTVFGTLGDWLDEQEAQMTEKERKELDDEIEPFIIPLPFTTKQVEPLPYRGSDPEWQTFIKVSKNHALVRDLECLCTPITIWIYHCLPPLFMAWESCWEPCGNHVGIMSS